MSDSNKIVDLLLRLAGQAGSRHEVPIGAVLVDREGRVVGRGYNQTHAKKDGLAHAELVALRQAQRKLGDWRMEGCTMYVTLEPCLMCLGAMANARVSKICYILADPLFGSVKNRLTKAQLTKLFPRLMVEKLSDEEAVKKMMKGFFATLRESKKK